MYPSPAGPIVSEVERESWSDIVRSNHILQSLKPYVEALLVNRIGRKPEYLLAPIDECYRLVGIVRRGWRGFSGGAELQEEVSIAPAGAAEAGDYYCMNTEAVERVANAILYRGLSALPVSPNPH